MRISRILFTLGAGFLFLVLAGCQRTPEDIQKWKAEGNITKLVSATGDTRQFMRLDAIAALAQLKDPEALPSLATLFSDPDLVIVHTSVEAVAAIGGAPAETYLLQALELESYPARTTAATALGELKSEKAVEPLIKALDDPYEDVALEAVAALGRIGDRAAVPALCKKIQHASTRVKLACAKSLCQLGGEEATQGLVPTFKELNPEIRAIAVNAFIEMGEPAIPYAYDALQGDTEQIQQCGISILQGLDAVPTNGKHAIRYELALTSLAKEPAVDPAVVERLVLLGDADLSTLLEGVASPSQKARETAFLALEHLGEPVAERVLEEALSHASREALDWLQQRESWSGAPSWRLDLWGGAAALSPDFKFESKVKEKLSKKGPDEPITVSAKGYKPSREYIPLLILQFAHSYGGINVFGITIRTEAEISMPDRRNTKLAVERLEAAASAAVLPLIAGLDDPNPQVSDGCAHVLGHIGDARAVQPLLKHLERKTRARESLTLSPFYTALQKLDDPSAEEALLKVQPNAERAERLFRETYPETEILHRPATNLKNPPLQPVSYTIVYLRNGKTAELTITFRRTKYGDWIPHPPPPESLPE